MVNNTLFTACHAGGREFESRPDRSLATPWFA